MIRLVATDLDGTLLKPDGTMPEGIFELIEELRALGIRFVAASGRQYGNLRRLFAPAGTAMGFLCENGAVVVLDDEVIGVTAIPRQMGVEIISDLEALGMDVLVSGRHTCYVRDTARSFAENMLYSLRNTTTVVSDLRAIPEDYLKISGYAQGGAYEQCKRLSPKWSGKINAVLAGDQWFDFTMSNKGTGIRMLMEKLALTADEIMAIGDHFNDESMLDIVGHPYLMQSANLALRKPGVTVCANVVEELRRLVKAN
ncbi:MAG: HAD family hydrolase, partial [Clostridia bacterium]